MKSIGNFVRWFLVTLMAIAIVFQIRVDAASPPVIFNYSISGKPGDIIGLQGYSFGTDPQVFLSRPGNQTRQLTVVNKGNNFVAAQIPSNEPFGLYEIQVNNGTASSSAVRINQARGTSFDNPEIAGGGILRIFGRNLLLAGANPKVRFVDPRTGTSLNATVSTGNSDAYILSVTAPSNIIPGTRYDIYVTNGYGDSKGETKAEKSILARTGGTDNWDLRVGWAADYDFYNNVYNVKTDPRLSLRATGNGSTDDQAAIQNAIDTAARAGGGVVYLPAGTYKLALQTDTLGMKMASRVVVQGAGRDSTIINYGYGAMPSVGGFAVEWPNNTSVAGIADLTIHNANEQGNWKSTMQAWGKVSEIFMQRIKFDLDSSEGFYLGNIDKLVIENSIFNQSYNAADRSPWLFNSNQNFVIRNNTATHSTGTYSLNNSNHGVIEYNHFTRDVGHETNFEVRNLSLNFSTDIAILNNTFDVINGTAVMRNDGETILSEGGGAIRPDENLGTVSSSSSQTLQDSNQNWNASSFTNKAIVALVSGRGTGQWRTITGIADSKTLKLDRPWQVTPNVGDRYATFSWSAANWIVKGNKLTDNPRGIMLYDASSRDVAIVDNTLVDNGGIYLRTDQNISGTDSLTKRHTLILNTQILNNVVSNHKGLRGAYIGTISAHVTNSTTFGVGLIGLEIRNNTLTARQPNTQPNSAVDEIIFEGYNNTIHYQYQTSAPFKETSQPALLGTIFQGNRANNCDDAYQLSTGAYRTTIWDPANSNVKQMLKDEKFHGSSLGARGTIVRS